MRFLAIWLVLAPAGAFAEVTYSKSMDVVDFLVDRNDWVGKRLTVTGCHIVMANVDQIGCRAGGTMSSVMYIDGKTLDREGLRRSLRLCGGFDELSECEADVSGLVANVMASPGLTDATVKWRKAK